MSYKELDKTEPPQRGQSREGMGYGPLFEYHKWLYVPLEILVPAIRLFHLNDTITKQERA